MTIVASNTATQWAIIVDGANNALADVVVFFDSGGLQTIQDGLAIMNRDQHRSLRVYDTYTCAGEVEEECQRLQGLAMLA